MARFRESKLAALAEARTEPEAQVADHPPAGWTAAAWAVYLTDPDGGRAPYRFPETAAVPPTAIEVASWGDM